MNNPNIQISGWVPGHEYKKFDVAFFSGNGTQNSTGCLPSHSGYYYCETAHTSSDDDVAYSSSNAPTGAASKWSREFFFKPGYGGSVTFEAKNERIDFGDGYFSLIPKSVNNIRATYALGFDGRTDREAKAISNFIESHSFEALSGAVSGVTGFQFKPFYPYDQKHEHFSDGYTLEQKFNDVKNIQTSFINETNSATSWLERFIPSGNTKGVWEAGKTYNLYDTVYHSGGVVGTLSGCDGYYYYTGISSSTATVGNSPTGDSTLWTNQEFLFKPSIATNLSNNVRFSTVDVKNDFVQRFNDGINTNNLKYSLVLEGRSNKEAVAISQFLLSKQNYQTFTFSPPQPHSGNLNFVCENWRHSHVYDDNHRFELQFEQNPLDLSREARRFSTIIATENGEVLAPFHGQDFGFQTYGATTGINFGAFMTGFSSGTGMFLVNSGDETILSTLSLSGKQATNELFKFADSKDDRIKEYSATSLTFKLHPGDSGRFDIIFSTTGHTGDVGKHAGIGATANTALASRISFHEGRVMYTADPGGFGGIKDSALTVSTTDEFLFADPSGDLKVELFGEASHNAAPGIPINLKVGQIPDTAVITGSWELQDPKTATGITVAFAVDDLNNDAFADIPAAADFTAISGNQRQNGWFENTGYQPYWYSATGIPTGITTFRHEPVLPSSKYYYKVIAANTDVLGVATSSEKTFATAPFTENIGASVTGAVITESGALRVILDGADGRFFNKVKLVDSSTDDNGNFVGEANKVLKDLGLSDYSYFSGIHVIIKAGTLIMSDDPSVPAFDCGTAPSNSTFNPLALKIVVEEDAKIIGAGGRGANGYNTNDMSFALSLELTDANKSDANTLSEYQANVGSIHELQGTGPIATRATKGVSEGIYLLPNGADDAADNTQPNDGENGGTALHIPSSWQSDDHPVKIVNNGGFIAGGGGGGGQGGVRCNNLPAMVGVAGQFKHLDHLRDGLVGYDLEYKRNLNEFTKAYLRRAARGTSQQPNFVSLEVRGGGGGGGGAGLRKNTINFTMERSSAAGGKGTKHTSRFQKTQINTSSATTPFGVIHGKPAENGENSNITILNAENKSLKIASQGGDGSNARKRLDRGVFMVTSFKDLEFKYPYDFNQGQGGISMSEVLRNAGGAGGFGGGYGMDGGNGEHPVQTRHRYVGVVGGVNYRAQPRNYGYGGSGGLCIETNGCDLQIISDSNNIPASGLGIAGGHRSETDAKSSELYRNQIGVGGYLTARNSGAANVKEAEDNNTLGFMSGIKNNGPTESQYVVATHSSYPAWKAFNQEIHPSSVGNAADYAQFQAGGFPYYLVYDFGIDGSDEDIKKIVSSYTITSAGADMKHYQQKNNSQAIFESVHTPISWELQATNSKNSAVSYNSPGGEPLEDVKYTVLHRVTNDVPRQENPVPLKVETKTADQDYVSIPGLIRSYEIDNTTAYRYYRLKILNAEGKNSRGASLGLCKIADFGLRGGNTSYAGFITVRNKFTT